MCARWEVVCHVCRCRSVCEVPEGGAGRGDDVWVWSPPYDCVTANLDQAGRPISAGYREEEAPFQHNILDGCLCVHSGLF